MTDFLRTYAKQEYLTPGAADAPAAVAGSGAYRIADALRLRDITHERLGDDMLVTGYPVYPEPGE